MVDPLSPSALPGLSTAVFDRKSCPAVQVILTRVSLLIVYVKTPLEIRLELLLLLPLFFVELPPLSEGRFCFAEHRFAVGLELFGCITGEVVLPDLHLLLDRPQKSIVSL